MPAAAAGAEVPCPWCRAVGPALPVVLPPTPGAHTPGPPEPLSLDDDLPAAPAPRRRWRSALVAVGPAAVAVGLAVAAVGYHAGRVPPTAWRAFVAPDGSCRAQLPADPAAEPVPPLPDFPMTRGGHRYTARGWYSGVTAAVGWQDLDPDRAKTMRLDDLAGGEFVRRRDELKATATARAAVRRADRDGVEYRYDTPAGPAADRMMLVGARLYVLSYAAPRLPAADLGMVRFWESFEVD